MQYTKGTKATYDAHTNLLDVIVEDVIEPGNGQSVASGRLAIRVLKDNGPYKKDERMEVTGFHCIPKPHIRFNSAGQARINPQYEWVTELSMVDDSANAKENV